MQVRFTIYQHTKTFKLSQAELHNDWQSLVDEPWDEYPTVVASYETLQAAKDALSKLETTISSIDLHHQEITWYVIEDEYWNDYSDQWEFLGDNAGYTSDIKTIYRLYEEDETTKLQYFRQLLTGTDLELLKQEQTNLGYSYGCFFIVNADDQQVGSFIVIDDQVIYPTPC